jgi:hypothetical protein
MASAKMPSAKKKMPSAKKKKKKGGGLGTGLGFACALLSMAANPSRTGLGAGVWKDNQSDRHHRDPSWPEAQPSICGYPFWEAPKPRSQHALRRARALLSRASKSVLAISPVREYWCYRRSASNRAFASLIPAASAFA